MIIHIPSQSLQIYSINYFQTASFILLRQNLKRQNNKTESPSDIFSEMCSLRSPASRLWRRWVLRALRLRKTITTQLVTKSLAPAADCKRIVPSHHSMTTEGLVNLLGKSLKSVFCAPEFLICTYSFTQNSEFRGQTRGPERRRHKRRTLIKGSLKGVRQGRDRQILKCVPH